MLGKITVVKDFSICRLLEWCNFLFLLGNQKTCENLSYTESSVQTFVKFYTN